MRNLKEFTKEQRKSLRVIKSHLLASGMISVTYVLRDFEANTVTQPMTSILEKTGGAKLSALNHFC